VNNASTPLEKFCHWEKTMPQNIFLRQPINGIWKTWTYQQAGKEVRAIAAALSGLPPKSNVAILSKNCSHWLMTDLAIWMAGHISVPIYPTLSAQGIQFILEHSEPKLIFIGKLDDFEKQRSGIPASIQRISFPLYGPQEGLLWDDLLKANQVVKNTPPDPNDIASIMYSSGTTGSPKGVMLTFKAFDFVGQSLDETLQLSNKDHFFSYLPLSHIAEKAYVEMGLLYAGGTVSFTESLEKFADNLREVEPTLFGGVPRIYAKFQEGILAKIPQRKLDLLLSLPIISTILKKALRKKLGLAKARVIISGAAPIPVTLIEWYKKIGIEIHEIYGMTENCGYSHGDHGKDFHIGTVGRTWNHVEAKISDEGEILTKHPGLMLGYFKDQETTTSVFTPDGFLRTGDKGTIDNEGYLTITGRVKDQFKTDKAKFIAPAPIELKLLINKDIEQVCVVGTGIPQPIALIVLSAFGKKKTQEAIKDSLNLTLKTVNATLESYERLTKVVILKEDWTIENGLMTPSLKVKRNEIEKIHLAKYPHWYAFQELVVWNQ
jgi:long-chain acyl-CoA synthetase